MGIVGLPNVGKSTFFNVLTKLNVPAQNYPFCTKEPNEARVGVPDERWEWLCEFHKPASRVSASLQIWDIAGLVRGAHEGHGLGNAFLSNINSVDGIFHVVRAFDDEDILHVENSVDPVRDLDIINEELVLKDLQRLERLAEEQEAKVKRAGTKAPKSDVLELETYHKCIEFLKKEKKPIRVVPWTNAEVAVLNTAQLLTAKPVIYLVNLSVDDYLKKKNKWLPKIKKWVDEFDGGQIIPFSAEFERSLLEMGETAAANYCKEKNVASTVSKIVKTGYHTLHLIHFFTAGSDEVKCWTVREGTLAPQAAGTIHSDMEKGFICAEVMKYPDFKELGSNAAVKAAGKLYQKGREYVIEDADICFFKFNPPKKK